MEKQKLKMMWHRVLSHLNNSDYYLLTLESKTSIKGFTTDAIKGNNVPPGTIAIFQQKLEQKLSDLRMKPLTKLSWLKNFSYQENAEGNIFDVTYDGQAIEKITDNRKLAQCLACLLSSRQEGQLELAETMIYKLPEAKTKNSTKKKTSPTTHTSNDPTIPSDTISLIQHEKIIEKIKSELSNKENTLEKKKTEISRLKKELKESIESNKTLETENIKLKGENQRLKTNITKNGSPSNQRNIKGFYLHKLVWWHGKLPEEAEKNCPNMPFSNLQFKVLNDAEYHKISEQLNKNNTHIIYYDPQVITTGEVAIMKRFLHAKHFSISLIPISINDFIEECRRYDV